MVRLTLNALPATRILLNVFGTLTPTPTSQWPPKSELHTPVPFTSPPICCQLEPFQPKICMFTRPSLQVACERPVLSHATAAPRSGCDVVLETSRTNRPAQAALP